jgi:hypothetical protein
VLDDGEDDVEAADETPRTKMRRIVRESMDHAVQATRNVGLEQQATNLSDYILFMGPVLLSNVASALQSMC